MASIVDSDGYRGRHTDDYDAYSTPSGESDEPNSARSTVDTPAQGHRGGSETRQTNENHDAYLVSIKVWTKQVNGSFTVLKAIEMRWSDDLTRTFGKVSGPSYDSVEFSHGERFLWFTVRAGDWVDGLTFSTTRKTRVDLGGYGGNDYPQNIGNGLFAGFHGRAGDDVDMLGGVFWQKT